MSVFFLVKVSDVTWLFPGIDLSDLNNYCRNSYLWTETRPFCFTVDPDIRWGFCPVHQCQGLQLFLLNITDQAYTQKSQRGRFDPAKDVSLFSTSRFYPLFLILTPLKIILDISFSRICRKISTLPRQMAAYGTVF